MATIKAKNSAGAWVDVAAGEAIEKKTSGFKMVWVPCAADRQSYDLSAYLLEDDDFILNFVCGFDAATGPYCQWVGSEGELREMNGKSNNALNNSNSVSPIFSMSGPSSRANVFKYDKESRIFYIEEDSSSVYTLGSYAALIYAG